jgi:putative membrane protein
MAALLIFVHIAANLVWIGSITAVGIIPGLTFARPSERGQIARAIYLRLSVPAFAISVLAGLIQLLSNTNFYFVQTRYMHAKLLGALIVVGLHHVLGARARRIASGKTVPKEGVGGWLTAALLVTALATAYVAVLKPF